MVDSAIHKLITHALSAGLIEPVDQIWAVNTLLEGLGLSSYTEPNEAVGEVDLAAVLEELMDDATPGGSCPRIRWPTGTALTPCSWAA